MKKLVLSLVLALLALGLFTGAASAAQGNQPLREGRGLLHDYIVAAFAEKVGLTVDEVNAAVNAGKTLYQVALDQGIAQADVPALLKSVHETALAAAAVDGVITQAQANQMTQRMAKRGCMAGVYPAGGIRLQDGTGFGAGRGMNLGSGTGTCPMGGTRPQDGTGLQAGRGTRLGGRGGQANP